MLLLFSQSVVSNSLWPMDWGCLFWKEKWTDAETWNKGEKKCIIFQQNSMFNDLSPTNAPSLRAISRSENQCGNPDILQTASIFLKFYFIVKLYIIVLVLSNIKMNPPQVYMSQLLASGGQSIGASASASVLPKSIQSWFPLRLTDLISLFSKELSRVFSSTPVQKHQLFGSLPSFLLPFYCLVLFHCMCLPLCTIHLLTDT